MKSFVLFGPTHSGKSTLAGYMLTCDMSDEVFMQRDKEHRKQIEKEGDGANYSIDMRLSLFFDESKDEHRRYIEKYGNSPGTSKQPHIKTLGNVSSRFTGLQLIDSLGADRNYKLLYRSLSMADIGIYVVDINDVYNLNYLTGESYEREYNKIFRPLYSWFSIQRKAVSSLIITLSKIDTINYNRIKIEQAIRTIHNIDRFSSIPICPISINTLNRESYHILHDKSHIAEWYLGKKTFDSILIECLDNKTQENGSFIGYIDTKRKPKKLSKDVLRIRVLRGRLSENDTIIIGPVIITSEIEKEPVFLKGLVKSVRPQDPTEVVTELESGCIGGVAFESLTYQTSRHSYSLKEIRTTNLSMMFDANGSGVEKGNLLTVKFNPKDQKDKELLSSLKLNTNIALIWFGKFVGVRIVGFHAIGEDLYCTLWMIQRSSDEVFVVPLLEQGDYKYLYHRFALQTLNKDLVPVNLKDVSTLSISDDISICIIIASQYALSNTEIVPYFMESPKYSVRIDGFCRAIITFDSIKGEKIVEIIRSTKNLTDDYQINNTDIAVKISIKKN